MFFRREKSRQPTFEERLAALERAGFTVERQGPEAALVSRNGCAARIGPDIGKAGVLVGGEIGTLVDGGFQKFLRTPSGKQIPALASHLKALHAFTEDLREGLGLTSLYNLSLGTVCNAHLYDRVEDRDRGVSHRPWDR